MNVRAIGVMVSYGKPIRAQTFNLYKNYLYIFWTRSYCFLVQEAGFYKRWVFGIHIRIMEFLLQTVNYHLPFFVPPTSTQWRKQGTETLFCFVLISTNLH